MTRASSQLRDDWQRLALARGVLAEPDLRAAETRAGETRTSVAAVLLEQGKVTEELIAQLTAEGAGLVYLDVLDYQIDPRVLELVPEALARKHTLLPLYRVGNSLTVATDDPWDATAIDEARLGANLPRLHVVLGTASAIRKAIDRHYGHKVVEEAAHRPAAATGPAASHPPGRRTSDAQRVPPGPGGPGDVPVAKLVDALLTEALEARASDIHLEPEAAALRVRYRIDGLLHEVKVLPADLHESLTSRIKLLAKLDITEHRLPQDGHLSLERDGRRVDLRVSTYPTLFGENVVIRVMDHSGVPLRLEELGLSTEALAQFAELIARQHGLVLVTGPTGSGKTTTLYAALARINSVTKNIMTIEDPVEHSLPLIRQTQINVKAGVTFAGGLRSLLRQDPDVIMVGEIRDRETAEIAIHAALTGHLVLSTLHTNDAVGAVIRMVEMGVEPYLVASTLLGVVSQRLVRRLCTHCRAAQPPSAQAPSREPPSAAAPRGRGCRFCQETGYLGRLGIFELFRVEEPHRLLLTQRGSADQLRALAVSSGMCTLHADGLAKVRAGLTTLEELHRVIPPDTGA